MINASAIRERFAAVGGGLNERSRRLLAAAEAKTASYGGITTTSRATGVARSTIGRGLKELADGKPDLTDLAVAQHRNAAELPANVLSALRSRHTRKIKLG